MAAVDDQVRKALLRRGFALEYATLGWNVAGIVVLAVAAREVGAGPGGAGGPELPVAEGR